MFSTSKTRSSARPEIKMTKSTMLRQKSPHQHERVKRNADLPSEVGVLRRSDSSRSSLAPSPRVLGQKSHSSAFSTSSLGSSPRASRETLNTSTSSLNAHSVHSFTSGDGPKSRLSSHIAKSVTDRLYRPPTPDPKLLGNFLRKSNRDLPAFERIPHIKQVKRQAVSVHKPEVTARYNVHDFIKHKTQSVENICAAPSQELVALHRRRKSDPWGHQAAKFVEDYNSEIQNGYKKDGIHFVQRYFQKSLIWLSPKVEAFLSSRSLGQKLASATNEERYTVEDRVFFQRPQCVENKLQTALSPQDEVDAYVDMIDMLCGEVSMEEFSPGYVIDKEPSTVPFTLVSTVGVQTDRLKSDASTNTYRPIMVNKLIETERKHNMSTSTDDLKKYVKPNIRYSISTTTEDLQQNKPQIVPSIHVESWTARGTSTADLQQKTHLIPSVRIDVAPCTQDLNEDLSDSSVTPRASPVSMVEEELESSSAYGSFSSNSLRRSLIEKVNNFQEEVSDNRLSERHKVSKAVMTDEETSQIHSELNRLTTERIEIIELLALNILNLPSSLTVELLEAKLNYSIGQTDQLLAMLEESCHLEANLSSLSQNRETVHITQEIIRQSRTELENSKKAIHMCLDEMRHMKAGGSSRNKFLNKEVMKMKRRADIEAFKLERMWEQLYLEKKRKKREGILRSSYPSVGRGDTAVDAMEKCVHYLSDLRKRSLLAASEDELNDLRMQSHLRHNDHDNWDTCSVGSTSSRSALTSPKQHKSHLVEMSRQLVTETEQRFPDSQSCSVSPHYYSSSPTYLPPSCSSVGDSGLGLSSFSSNLTSWRSRYNKHITSNSAMSSNNRKSTVYKSTYRPSALSMSHRDLLIPSRPSYRSAGRYSAK